MPLYKSLTFFYLTVSFKFRNFSFHLFLLFVPAVSASSFTSYIVQIVCLALAWILYPLHFSLLHLIKKPKHSSSNHGLCCFNSYRLRLSLAKVLMFPLMFSQALFMSSPSLKFFKPANLSVISI